jgi:hypothetical protein
MRWMFRSAGQYYLRSEYDMYVVTLGAYDTVLYCTVKPCDVFAFHRLRMWMSEDWFNKTTV